MTTRIAILLFEGVEELDAVGPWEVFAWAASLPEADFEVFTVAETDAPVRAAKGLRLLPDHDLESAPPCEVLLVPGGKGTHGVLANPRLMGFIRERAPGLQWLTSVCTGARVLLQAGLTEGRRITTYHGAIAELAATGKAAEVLRGVRFVRDGNLVTSAGVSAGIDMALWLVGQLVSPAFAREVQHGIQYDPAPPYTAEV